MIEEIQKIVLAKNIKNKILSKDDMRKICSLIIHKMKYDKMIRRIVFEKKNTIDFASYDGEDMFFYYDCCLKLAEENYHLLKKEHKNLEGGIVPYYNFEILDTIFHEFSHVRQDYLICHKKKNIETEIYQICNKIADNIKHFYKENYDVILTEVNAFIDGLLQAYIIYEKAPIAVISNNDKDIYAKIAFKEILNNYFDNQYIIISSSEMLLDILKYYDYDEKKIHVDRLDEIVYDNNFSLYSRLRMGLPITVEEYHCIKKMYNNIDYDSNFVKKIKNNYK